MASASRVEQQARIFERFESGRQGARNRGAGLGLSIAKSLVDLHGGQIALNSEPDVGTKVVVRLPTRMGPGQRQEIAQDGTRQAS